MIALDDKKLDLEDAALAERSASGDRAALTELLRRHQQWVFAVALRFARDPDAAADLAQDALLRVVTRIAQFEGRSSFRTWAWRIVLGCFLNAKRSRSEDQVGGFEDYAAFLDDTGFEDGEAEQAPQEWAFLVQEVRVQCMLGMLLCLDREQRLVLILGAILGVPAPAAAAVLQWSPAQFRKRLERARADLASFMNEKCGLVNPANPCRCPKKTAALVRQGYVDVERLRFTGPSVRVALDEAPSRVRHLDMWSEDACVQLFREHPNLEGPDAASALAHLVETAGFGALFPADASRRD
jgi:RNA polymerase sigma factor (sigma-70 family)